MLFCGVGVLCCLIVGLGIAGVWSGVEALRGGADLQLLYVELE